MPAYLVITLLCVYKQDMESSLASSSCRNCLSPRAVVLIQRVFRAEYLWTNATFNFRTCVPQHQIIQSTVRDST